MIDSDVNLHSHIHLLGFDLLYVFLGGKRKKKGGKKNREREIDHQSNIYMSAFWFSMVIMPIIVNDHIQHIVKSTDPSFCMESHRNCQTFKL